jgi:hypothetical protein
VLISIETRVDQELVFPRRQTVWRGLPCLELVENDVSSDPVDRVGNTANDTIG